TAMAILEDARKPAGNPSIVGRFTNWLAGNDGELAIDWDVVQQRVNEVYASSAQGGAQFGRATEQALAAQQQAHAQYAQAQAQLDALLKAAQGDRIRMQSPEIERARRAVNEALSQVTAANRAVSGYQTNTARPDQVMARDRMAAAQAAANAPAAPAPRVPTPEEEMASIMASVEAA